MEVARSMLGGWAIALALTIGVALTQAQPGNAVDDVGALPPGRCLIISYAVQYTCYPPSQAHAVRETLSFFTVDPSGVVSRVAGLSLRQVITTGGAGNRPAGSHARAGAVMFVYGRIPGPPGGIPVPSPAYPKFVLLSEGKGHLAITGPRIFGIAGVRLPWRLQEQLVGRNTAVNVTSNESRSSVLQIGRQLLAEARGSG